MRTPRARTLAMVSSHHMKTSRRCSFLASHVEVTLRFASILIIAIAVCEFTGLSQSAADAFTSVALRFSVSSEATRPDVRLRRQTSSALVVNSVDAHYIAPKAPTINRKRRALHTLYNGIHPDSSVEHALATRRLPTPPPISPSFALETHWSEDNFDIKICRIHNACLKKDGVLLVHGSLKKHESSLHDCMVSKIAYMTNPSEDFAANDTTAAFDLFGLTPARFHIPHFLTDTLPMLYAAELIRPTWTHPTARSECIPTLSDKCPNHIKGTKLRSAIYVEDRVMTMPVSAWVPQFAAMLPGHPYLYFPSTLFDNGGKACFRSIIAFNRRSYTLRRSEWYGEQNRLFERYGLTRKSVIRPPPIGKSNVKCHTNVVIVNRFGWERRHGMLLGRDLVNVAAVKKRIERDAPAAQNPEIGLTVTVEYFENKTFAEQVDIMQRADVIVGVHGAGLSNILFARKDTPVLEVYPFAYYAGPFPGVARALFLQYSYVIAEPDTKTFLECIEIRARRSGDSSISRTAKEMWTEALKRRKEDGELDFLKTHKFTDPNLSNLKMCARTQRMKVDVVETSRRVLQMAQSVCGGEVEL